MANTKTDLESVREMNIEEIKQQVASRVCAVYPNLHSQIEEDPEDGTIIRVRVYGVADESYADVRTVVRDIISGCGHSDGYDLVPSIVRLSDTKKLFPSMVPCDLSGGLDKAYDWDNVQRYRPEWHVSSVTLPDDLTPKKGFYAIAA